MLFVAVTLIGETTKVEMIPWILDSEPRIPSCLRWVMARKPWWGDGPGGCMCDQIGTRSWNISW